MRKNPDSMRFYIGTKPGLDQGAGDQGAGDQGISNQAKPILMPDA
jgi:hypothetical protein